MICLNNYLILKVIGITFKYLTGTPFCLAGIHLGILFTILTASSSQPPPIPLITFTSDIEPSFSVINCTYTVPDILFLIACLGYFIFL